MAFPLGARGALLAARGLAVLSTCAALAACAGEEDPPSQTTTTTTSPPGVCDGADPAPESPASWCAQIASGPAGVRAAPVDLSAAHAAARFFGPIALYADADQALPRALGAPDALDQPDLAAYAEAIPGVACAPGAAADALPPASVTLEGDVAVVRPGTGAVEIPAGARAVLVDLRDLPDAPGLREALEAAVGPALASPIPRPSRRVREHFGMVDEVFSPQNVYANEPADVEQDPIPASGAADLPLALLTGGRIAPESAELAAALRLAGRAWLVGQDLRVAVAEARWHGVGDAGLMVRVRELRDGAGRFPDLIPADRAMAHPECFAAEIVDAGEPPPIDRGPAERPGIAPVAAWSGAGEPYVQPFDLDLGVARAALIASHGAARTFFPYFDTVGDTIDDRLLEVLGTLGDAAPERRVVRDLLRRFGNAIVDGHNFIYDFAGSDTVGSFPVLIEDIDGEPVVRRSAAIGVNPGDTITSIGGVPAADWYATELARTSAASDGYRFDIATRRYLVLPGPTEFGLRDPDGATRTITFEPQPLEDLYDLGSAPSMRPAGWLTDLGAPSLYYLNMEGEVVSDDATWLAALEEAQGAAGLVLDMRGYPVVNHYITAAHLIQQTFSSPIFRIPVLSGTEARTTVEEAYELPPQGPPSYDGPIVLLVGHSTVSAAENFSTMLVDAGRVKVIGRQSASTNGNITGVQLPGGYGFTFTGMEVRHADAERSQFHGIGIAPDADVLLTPADFRDGLDPELLAAIAWLSAP